MGGPTIVDFLLEINKLRLLLAVEHFKNKSVLPLVSLTPIADSQEFSTDISHKGMEKEATEFFYKKWNSFFKPIAPLAHPIGNFSEMPEESAYDDITLSKGSSEQDANSSLTNDLLRMDVGNINSKHLVEAFNVRLA